MLRTIINLREILPNRNSICFMSFVKKVKPIKPVKADRKSRRVTSSESVSTSFDKEMLEDEEDETPELPARRLDPREYAANMEREMMTQKNRAAYRVMRNKYFPDPSRKCVLTWAAKEQMRYLHKLDPKAYSYDVLAECFPVASPHEARNVIKNPWIPKTQEEVDRHDGEVIRDWNDLLIQRDPFVQTCKKKGLSPHVNQNLQSSVVRIGRPEPTLTTGPPGSFSMILTVYNELKSKKQPQTDSTPLKPLKEEEEFVFDHHSHEDDLMSATHLIGDAPIRGRHVQFSDIQKRMLKNAEGIKALESGSTNEEQRIRKRRKRDPFIPISKTETESAPGPNIRLDSGRNSKTADAYAYTEEYGYQHPYGKSSDSPEKLPKVVRGRRGSVVRYGDSFYDNRGDFIFRVPGLGNREKTDT